MLVQQHSRLPTKINNVLYVLQGSNFSSLTWLHSYVITPRPEVEKKHLILDYSDHWTCNFVQAYNTFNSPFFTSQSGHSFPKFISLPATTLATYQRNIVTFCTNFHMAVAAFEGKKMFRIKLIGINNLKICLILIIHVQILWSFDSPIENLLSFFYIYSSYIFKNIFRKY